MTTKPPIGVTSFDHILAGATSHAIGRSIYYTAPERDGVRLFVPRGKHLDHTSHHTDEASAIRAAEDYLLQRRTR